MAAEPWRARCPEGHTSIRRRKSGYRCDSCAKQYDGEPLDAKEDDLDETSQKTMHDDRPHPRTVLSEICEIHDRQTRNWVTSDELETVGERHRPLILHTLNKRGFVEKRGQSTGYLWRPTESAKRMMDGGQR